MEEESNTNKKYIVTGIITLLIILALIAAFFFFRNSKSENPLKGVALFSQSEDSTNSPNPISNENSQQTPTPNTQKEVVFFKIADGPIAGAGYVATTENVYYVLKENGHIFSVGAHGGESAEITNTTIPRVHEAIISNNGKQAIFRYLDGEGMYQKIKTYLVELNQSSDTGVMNKKFLPDGIQSISYLPLNDELAYILPVDDGSSVSVVKLSTRSVKEIMRNGFREWLPYLTKNGLLLATKPSAQIPGYFYRYDIKNGSFERLSRDKKGLTVLPNQDGTRYLYAENISNTLVFGSKGDELAESEDAGIKGSDEVVSQITTLPEKCTWGNDGVTAFCAAFTKQPKVQLPDEWYRGEISTDDSFWVVNTTNGEAFLIADPVISGLKQSFDATNLFLSQDQKILYFIDKNSGELWGLNIKTTTTDTSMGTGADE